MKFLTAFSAAVLIAVTLLSCLPLSDEAEIYDNMIRLHVLAVSDTDEEQSRKLRVRDAVLACLETSLSAADNYADALTLIRDAIPAIEKCAKDEVGDACTVSVTLDRETYPIREYDGYLLPAGEYMSLRVILGEGEGQNWWCVLFPQLCIAKASQNDGYEDFIAAGFSPEQYRLVRRESSTKYKIRFRILELLSEFGWLGEG